MPIMPAKDPDATVDYSIDWSSWLGSDTIQTSTWIVPSGLTEDSSSNTSTVATIWLSGGTAGQTYVVTNRIETAGGRTEDRSLVIPCREK